MAQPPAFDIDTDKIYRVTITTDRGQIVTDLDPQLAPNSVNHFVQLTRAGFYDGLTFHRVEPGFVIQGGDPEGTGRGGPGYRWDDEPVLGEYTLGAVAMANAGPNTNGSQFFITFAATPWLDGHYNIFGQVIAGEAVLGKLQRIDPQNPEAVVGLGDTLGLLASKGVELGGRRDTTVGDFLTKALGAPPVSGQSFSVGAYRAVVGSSGGKPAIAFFPLPDTLERVVIAVKPAK